MSKRLQIGLFGAGRLGQAIQQHLGDQLAWQVTRNEPPHAKVDAIIEAKGLKQMNDSGALEKIIDEVMVANASMVEQFRAGKDKLLGFFVGQVMKQSQGKANPQAVNDILRKKLDS